MAKIKDRQERTDKIAKIKWKKVNGEIDSEDESY